VWVDSFDISSFVNIIQIFVMYFLKIARPVFLFLVESVKHGESILWKGRLICGCFEAVNII
jgi:hypothetical protein